MAHLAVTDVGVYFSIAKKTALGQGTITSPLDLKKPVLLQMVSGGKKNIFSAQPRYADHAIKTNNTASLPTLVI